MILEYFAKKLISYDESKALRKLRENYKAFADGLVSFPLNIPGTAYHACLQVLNSHYNAYVQTKKKSILLEKWVYMTDERKEKFFF